MEPISDWYQIGDVDRIDSPALVVYPDRIQENIDRVIGMAPDRNRLRPHVKTTKMVEVCTMMLQSGITRFKCATIAEAEMLAMAGAPDVLLAYQPVGPKILRLVQLSKAYPGTRFSCLTDDAANAAAISAVCLSHDLVMDVFIDLNVGMNRTGIRPSGAPGLAGAIAGMNGIRLAGIHAYDGHIHDEDIALRQERGEAAYALAKDVSERIRPAFPGPLMLVIGGTPTFPVHIRKQGCECSPGTFVFWDWGYKHMLAEMPFEYAALVITRIISVIDEHHVCTDLGHKSVAAENPLPRVHFLNAPDARPVSQSEEHLVLEVPDAAAYHTGDVLYGVPVHICPTVALYEKAYVVRDNVKAGVWNVIARNRTINY